MTTFRPTMIRIMEMEIPAARDMMAEIPVIKGTTTGVTEMKVRGTRVMTAIVPETEDTVIKVMETEATITRVLATKGTSTMIREKLKQTGPDYVIGVGKEDITPVSVRRPCPHQVDHKAAGEITVAEATVGVTVAGETMAHRREETDKEISKIGTVEVTAMTEAGDGWTDRRFRPKGRNVQQGNAAAGQSGGRTCT